MLQVDTGTLLDAGLSRLLNREAGIEVRTITYKDDSGFRRDVESIQPDVILLNRSGLPNCDQILKMLSGMPGSPTVRIIVVNIENNIVDVYDRHEWRQFAWKQVVMQRSDDLAALTRGDSEL